MSEGAEGNAPSKAGIRTQGFRDWILKAGGRQQSSRRPFDCLVAGDANVDLLVEGTTRIEPGTEKLATDLDLVMGGSSAITAFNLSRLGARVLFAGAVGDDTFGRFVEDKLKTGRVDLRGLRRTKVVRTGVTIWHCQRGKRAGVTYPGTLAMLTIDDIPGRLLQLARHFHMGAYFFLTGIHKDAPRLFERARELGLTTSLDTNYDPLERWESNLHAVLQHTDIFLPNEDEVRKITGERRVARAAQQLAQLAGAVIVKRGAKGALAVSAGELIEVPARPTSVVDTTGAGDSFNAGFLARFFQGGSLKACVRAGIVAGSRCVTRRGGTAAFESREGRL